MLLKDQYHITFVHIKGLIIIIKKNIILGSYLGLRGSFYGLKHMYYLGGFIIKGCGEGYMNLLEQDMSCLGLLEGHTNKKT